MRWIMAKIHSMCGLLCDSYNIWSTDYRQSCCVVGDSAYNQSNKLDKQKMPPYRTMPPYPVRTVKLVETIRLMSKHQYIARPRLVVLDSQTWDGSWQRYIVCVACSAIPTTYDLPTIGSHVVSWAIQLTISPINWTSRKCRPIERCRPIQSEQ